jgi:hypothetical protein
MLVAVVSVGLLAAMLETRSARKKLKNRFNWRSSDRWTPVQKELVERLYAAMPPQFQFVASGALAEKAAVIMNYNDAYGQCEAVDWYERALVGVRTKQD